MEVARDPERPAAVAEVALELSQDGRECERRERRAALRVEPIDRLDQSDGGDLLEVFDVLDVAIAPREVVRQRKEPLHDRVASRRAAIVRQAREQRPLVLPAKRVASLRGVTELDGGVRAHHATTVPPTDEVVKSLCRQNLADTVETSPHRFAIE